MQPIGYRIIQDEHRSLAAVLDALLAVLRELRGSGAKPDFRLFRAMVYYIDAYPEKLHHPKEERFLFERLRGRTHEADQVLGELGKQHASGASLIRKLEQALLRWEEDAPDGQMRFEQAAEEFAGFYRAHMKSEEAAVLPLALKVLTPEDWNVIDVAFKENGDPLRDTGAARDFNDLFTRIVNLAPAPIGLGPALARN